MSANPASRTLLVLTGLAILGGLVLRVWASFSLFWLDEVLTLAWPRQYGYWELLTGAKHDNNHVLNSMFLRLVGEPGHWFVYRLLSIVTGTIAIACMARIGWRRSPIEGVIAAALGAFTYVLIHYSSEARGYGPLCGFALLSFLAVDRATRRPGWGIAIGFWATVVLGVLSHSTYAFAYVGFAAWSAAVWLSPDPGRPLRSRLGELVRLHALPVAVLALVYFGRIRGMAIGGGPEFDLLRVAINALAHCVGRAYGGAAGDIAALAAVAAVGVELVLRAKEATRDRSWVFYAAMLLVTPLLILFVLKPNIIYMRYVLVCVPFILLLLSGLIARISRRGRVGQVAAAALVVTLVGLNVPRIEGLLRAGRGQYLKALRYIEANDPATVLEITGNNHLHVQSLLDYYKRFLQKPVAYIHPKSHPARPPRWLIHDIQRFMQRPPPGQQLTSTTPWGRYICKPRARFHFNSQSGANWYVFEHEAYR